MPSFLHTWWLRGLLLGLAGVVCAGISPAGAQVFLPDDPLHTDNDRMPLQEEPLAYDVSDYNNAVVNVLGSPGEGEGPAVNVNTLGEVPRSTWYTPRHYYDPMTTEELQRGPNTTGGPANEGPLRVVSLKLEGVSPGLTLEDRRGDRYLIKFDLPQYPEMASAAEVISTKILYALGYHVPENYIFRFDPDRLVADEEEGVSPEDVAYLLGMQFRYEDGTTRAMASRYLPGRPVGPFRFYGTRPDDPNDIFPHEARRELRALRVIAGWLAHFDARANNSLDVLVEEDGKQYVRHYLIDFGSTLGGGPLGPKKRWYGHEYAVEVWPMLLRFGTLGFAGSAWADYDYPDYAAVGRFDVDTFDPEGWKPGMPNPAFQRMDARDAFWAAKQIAHFTGEELRAIAATGKYREEASTAYVARTLAGRRDKIAGAFLRLGGGLDRFRVAGGCLRFDDLLARHGSADPERPRTVTWQPFDNQAGTLGATLHEEQGVRGTALAIPMAEVDYLAVTITTDGEGATRVFLRRTAAGYEVVGLKRRGPDEPFRDGWG